MWGSGSARLQGMSEVRSLPAGVAETLRFGVFAVDRNAGELRRNGVKVKLQDQPLQILLTLLERPGEVVIRDELRARLWPHDTFVDFEHSINTAVRRLRDALGDSAENPRFIETVARKGYRFLAPVSGALEAAGATVAAGAPPRPARRWWILGAVLLALFVGVIVGFRVAHSTATQSPNIIERRLTANAPELPVKDGVISPDGKYLAFTDPSGFYLRQVETGETHALNLQRGFDARPRSWFPDGTHLLVTSAESSTEPESIWEISLMGGTPRKLIAQGSWPSISPDGSAIAYLASATQFKDVALNKEIWLARSDGEQPRRLVGGGDDVFGAPVWSPDGKHLAFMRGKFMSGMPFIRCQLETLNVATGESHILLSIAGQRPTVAWAPDGRLIYSRGEAVPNQNDSNLWALRVDRDGRALGSPFRLTHGTGEASALSITSDGERLAFFRQAVEPDVYVADLEANGTKLSALRRLTLDERADFPYSWTPDNKAVIFTSDRNGAFNVFRQGVPDGEPEVLIRSQEDVSVPRLSPDGKSILYLITPSNDASASSNSRLMRAPLAGGPPQLVLEAPGISNQQCAQLPSTVCIFSRFEPGHEQFFYFDPEKGLGAEIKKAEIRSINAYDFNWSLSPDGKMLATARREEARENPSIQILPLGDGEEKVISVPGWAGVGSIDWAADSKSIWATVYNSGRGGKTLVNVALSGRVRPMLGEDDMASGAHTLGWAIPSPDGKHLAIWKAHGDSNVWMLENY
jgi:Tol biopolymer transport system component/DNA-binding winged helix-turn-helix (wHTH) protein